MRLPLPIGKTRRKASAPSATAERLVNGYLEVVTDAKEPDLVLGTPGLVLRVSGLDGAIRGRLNMGGTLYVVMGTKLYSVSSAWVASELGSIPGTDRVSMDGDGTNVVIVAGGEIYVWNGSALAAVTDPDAPAASSVVWVDGYFIFGEDGTDSWFISAISDPTSYDALDFAAAEWKPDKLVTPVLLRRTVYLFGEATIEAQQNVGAADFPFVRYEDIFINVGLAARDGVTAVNDTLYWHANDGTIRRLDGVSPTRISTTPIETLIKTWSDPTATVASSHVWLGHLFVLFWNPDGCICWDQTSERWHERASNLSATTFWSDLVTCYDKAIVGSSTEGKLYTLEEDAYDEAGATLPFEMVTSYAYAGKKKFTVDEVEVVAETGVGDSASDPKIRLDRTKDGQHFTTAGYRSLGRAGEREKRIIFGGQGEATQMAFKLRITDPVKRAIQGVWVEVDVEA